MTLHTEVVGSGDDLVLVHGFTQTGRSWRRVADSLSAEHRVTTVDAPGHGGSSDVRADLVDGAAAIGAACGAAVYVGYSMGARFALHVALRQPAVVRALVLLSGTPGIADDAERAARLASDEALANHLETVGVSAFVEEWLRNPMFAGLPYDPTDRADRMRNTTAGLASSLRLAGTGTQRPLWGELETLTMPVLVLAGTLDPKFTAIGEQMATAIGANGRFEPISGAGHSAHLEQPSRFLATIRAWLRLL